MRRWGLGIAVASAFAMLAIAADARPLSVAEILKRPPSSLVGKTLQIAGMSCVDNGPGFLCVGGVGTAVVAIDAVVLGDVTSVAMSERLVENCKGDDRIELTACQFTVTVRPTSFERGTVRSGAEVLKIYARELDLE